MFAHFKSRGLLFVLTIGILAIAGCTGGGETVISGLGNSGNYIGKDDEIAMLANALAQHRILPRVSDEEIVSLYEHVQAKAREGDFAASAVILRLAAYQRKIEAEEAED
jgi:hypothetical protein